MLWSTVPESPNSERTSSSLSAAHCGGSSLGTAKSHHTVAVIVVGRAVASQNTHDTVARAPLLRKIPKLLSTEAVPDDSSAPHERLRAPSAWPCWDFSERARDCGRSTASTPTCGIVRAVAKRRKLIRSACCFGRPLNRTGLCFCLPFVQEVSAFDFCSLGLHLNSL